MAGKEFVNGFRVTAGFHCARQKHLSWKDLGTQALEGSIRGQTDAGRCWLLGVLRLFLYVLPPKPPNRRASIQGASVCVVDSSKALCFTPHFKRQPSASRPAGEVHVAWLQFK